MSLTDREYLAISQARTMLQTSGVWDLEDDLSCLIDRYIERADKSRALDEFMLAVQERCNRIPLGHIVGMVEFDDMPLVVGSGVFIPRPHSKIIHKWLETVLRCHRELMFSICVPEVARLAWRSHGADRI